MNLGLLGAFKYYGFFAASLAAAAERVGFTLDLPTLAIVLPVGISFYTFQTLSYTIDIHRGDIEPVDDFLDFALFVAYFPQLVAGPIERAGNLLPRLQAPRIVDASMIRGGCTLILFGMVKKVVVADAAAPMVERAFSSAGEGGFFAHWAGAGLFGVQIYGDFSGYTDIARGVSLLLGIPLMGNFARPYLASSITEFWRRWHISLSTWLRDYLYIPLGGNRGGRARTYVNLMVTMVLGGLWHGAAWTFVVWGVLHGLFLAGHKWWSERFPRSHDAAGAGRGFLPRGASAWAGWGVTLVGVHVAWVFFRAPDFGTAFAYMEGMVTLSGAPRGAGLLLLGYLVAIVLLVDYLSLLAEKDRGLPAGVPLIPRTAVYVVLLLLLLSSGGTSSVPFIYFQF